MITLIVHMPNILGHILITYSFVHPNCLVNDAVAVAGIACNIFSYNNNLPTMYSVVLPFHCTSARCTLPLSSTKYIINLASGGPVRSTPVMSNRRARESAPSARFYCLGAD